MILSDFAKVRIVQNGPLDHTTYGHVTVTTSTGYWKWRKETTEVLNIARKRDGAWFFMDTGEFCPPEQIDALERSWNARLAP